MRGTGFRRRALVALIAWAMLALGGAAIPLPHAATMAGAAIAHDHDQGGGAPAGHPAAADGACCLAAACPASLVAPASLACPLPRPRIAAMRRPTDTRLPDGITLGPNAPPPRGLA